MKNRKLFDALVNARDKYNAEQGYAISIRFMVDCLKIIQNDCSDIARESILVAERFCARDATADELTAARVACWTYLDKMKKKSPATKLDGLRMQAVISALYPEPSSDDLLEILTWFVDIFIKVGNYDEIVFEKLKDHFKLD